MKTISIVTACYNEEENVLPLIQAVENVMSRYRGEFGFEHIFIDNCSEDRTVELLRNSVAEHPQVRVICNSRNFGHIRSPFHGLIQAHGDAVISLVADFQDPPEMIHKFIEKWREGFKMVLAVKKTSRENPLMFHIRARYYRLVKRISEVELIENFTGFGLFDKVVMDELRKVRDPYPYFRGLLCEVGFSKAFVDYDQPTRVRGITKNNFYTLYDMAMLGITTNSKVPLRLATIAGFFLSAISLVVALVYLVLKLAFWSAFPMGTAPILIALFFFSSVQLLFIGILGEYIAMVNTRVSGRPLVVEKERINFPADTADDGKPADQASTPPV